MTLVLTPVFTGSPHIQTQPRRPITGLDLGHSHTHSPHVVGAQPKGCAIRKWKKMEMYQTSLMGGGGYPPLVKKNISVFFPEGFPKQYVIEMSSN